jgi:hypothetical protein
MRCTNPHELVVIKKILVLFEIWHFVNVPSTCSEPITQKHQRKFLTAHPNGYITVPDFLYLERSSHLRLPFPGQSALCYFSVNIKLAYLIAGHQIEKNHRGNIKPFALPESKAAACLPKSSYFAKVEWWARLASNFRSH